MQLILISGLSGSGKSIALHVLEDAAYYCVDNLPVKLLPEVVGFLQQGGYTHVAISIDVRSAGTVTLLPQQFADLNRGGVEVHVLFLEAKTDTLVKRFSETRRRHPLSDGKLTLPESIQRERELLADIADIGHRIDTSELRPAQLRAWVVDFAHLNRAGLTLLFQSFAFKHGIPLDADIVFDARCLPNPYYDPLLRPLNGKHPAVIEVLGADAQVVAMQRDISQYLDNWLPWYDRDNRSYLTVAIGCTGGQHRSVYLVEGLARHFQARTQVLVRHRELTDP
jgi:UPF0042 nucleotide-binding protein